MAISLPTTTAGVQVLGECWDGYEAGFDTSRGPWITRRYFTPNWAARLAICNALMGVGYGVYPHRCPESTNLLCREARVVGQGEAFEASGGGTPFFNQTLIDATYSIPPWPTFPEDQAPEFPPDANENAAPYVYMEQDIDWDVELMKIPDTTYKFENSNTVVDIPVHKSIAVAEFVVVRKWETLMPYANIAAYLGMLNATTLFGQPKGQLQLKKVKTKRSFVSDGTRAQDQQYVFKWRQYDHNQFMHPLDAQFYNIVDSSGNYVYQYGNIGAVLS